MNDLDKWFEAWHYQAFGTFPVLIFLSVIRDYNIPIVLNAILSIMAVGIGVLFVMIVMCLREYEEKRKRDETGQNK